MTIDKIYINTHRYDLALTSTCVASIRYWYPDVPIFLIVDYSNGRFPSRKMLARWNLQVLDTGKQHYGWGFGKFEPLLLTGQEYFLVLDADTVMTGPVLDNVKDLKADFVVDREVQPIDKFKLLYYDPVEAEVLFPGFEYPGYSFNTGQWIARGSVLSKVDFSDFITWQPAPILKHPAYFKQADQGILNLLVHLKEKKNEISVEKIQLMIWPDSGGADFIDLGAIRRKEKAYPYIIHWAGIKFSQLTDFPRADILRFYESYFYSKYNSLEILINKVYRFYLTIEKKLVLKYRKMKRG